MHPVIFIMYVQEAAERETSAIEASPTNKQNEVRILSTSRVNLHSIYRYIQYTHTCIIYINSLHFQKSGLMDQRQKNIDRNKKEMLKLGLVSKFADH